MTPEIENLVKLCLSMSDVPETIYSAAHAIAELETEKAPQAEGIEGLRQAAVAAANNADITGVAFMDALRAKYPQVGVMVDVLAIYAIECPDKGLDELARTFTELL